MGLDGRPLVPGDAGDWVALLDAIEDADGSDDYSSEQDVREAWKAIFRRDAAVP